MNEKPKKKFAIRLYEALFPQAMTRTYAAAKVNRLNAGWTSYSTSANYESRSSLDALIARSRQMARDDLHITNYLRLMRSCIIGIDEIKLQSDARTARGKLNVKLNQRVEEAWWRWTHEENCTISKKLCWKEVQEMAVTHYERDGAFLIQKIFDADNPFGFALKLWDITWLDLTYNEVLKNGRRIVMSIELDAYDRPIAYYLTTPNSEVTFSRGQTRTRTRVPAEEIVHGVYNLDDESQVHGIPGTAAALLPAKNAYSYTESVVMASRASVNTFGVLKNTMPDGEEQFTGQENSEGTPQHPFINSSPLSITPLLPGWELQQFKPEHPTQNHPQFKQSLDMDIAVALGVPYFLLMDNWEAVNFSSSRGGLGEFRDRCRAKQKFIINKLCRPIFNAWLRQAWLTGQLQLTADEFEEIKNPAWQPRGFDYIKPTEDIAADVEKLRNRLTTPSAILAEKGIDYVDYLDRWVSDKELAASKGVDIEAIYSEQKAAAATPAKDDGDDPPPKKEPKPGDRGYSNGVHQDQFAN